VPGDVILGSAAAPSPKGITVGFYGKLPARGDFVRVGLPRAFTDPWDAWLQSVVAGSRSVMGEDWLPAFLEAPVWRFNLPRGMCGPEAVLGLMLPSVDRAGRYFPLTFAALSPHGIGGASAEAWLDMCEAAGRAALEHDMPPQAIADMVEPFEPSEAPSARSVATWWSEGSTRVGSACLAMECLPDAVTYARMLGAGTDSTTCTSADEEGKLQSP
jgi:type VI secretion system protein ImpM